MDAVNAIHTPAQMVKAKLADYIQLIKLRLSLLVVFSAAMAYLFACNRHVDFATIWLLSIGGFMITGTANTLNQVIERDSDKLMKRTAKRPLPDGRMKAGEALVFACILGVIGLSLLYRVNSLCAILGAVAIVIYAGVYTPLKKATHLTVVPGAVAGSLPVVIGCVAATGHLSAEALLLFSIQFIWQFPHTWSIAWLLDDEYNKAGIKMMPMEGGRSRASAFIILLSTFLIIPTGLLLYMYNNAGIPVGGLLTLAGIGMAVFGYKLYRSRTP
ncbi:MAG TPA: heme o synthase, partial [Bacteroidia bacterium]|nr:heme o synthase [Bacteroidia bacterium]